MTSAATDLKHYAAGKRYSTILADPPWQFMNKTGKVAPEHKRLARYGTMKLDEIAALPVTDIAAPTAHLYLWCPNALLPEGLLVMRAWGFTYKSDIVWHKIRKDGGSDGRGVGFYFRNVTELILFGVRGKNARTLAPGRSQVNLRVRANANIRENLTNNTRSSSLAVRVRFSNYLGAVPARAGRHGVIKPTKATPLRGRPTQTIRKRD